MSFLDKKEREIDIKLTPHGKRLYSEGKLHPFYYRFFDDDILYDASYAGIEENQEDAESRITNDTPRLSTQVTFKSREESLNYQSLDVDNLSIEDQEEVFGKIESALGNSGIGNQSASNLYSRVYNHKFESVEKDKEDYEIDLGTFFISINKEETTPFVSREPQDGGFFSEGVDDLSSFDITEFQYAFSPFSDGGTVIVENGYLLFETSEDNVDILNEMFDIEIFEIEEIGSEEFMKRLYFEKEATNVVNDVMIDKNLVSLEEISIPEDRRVETYFDVEVDFEVPNEVYCRHGIEKKSYNIFVNDDVGCGCDKRKLRPDVETNLTGPSGDECD